MLAGLSGEQRVDLSSIGAQRIRVPREERSVGGGPRDPVQRSTPCGAGPGGTGRYALRCRAPPALVLVTATRHRVREAIALVANMGELPVFVVTDQFVFLGLVKQEGVDGIPVLLSLSDLLEQAGELQISLRRHLESVPQPLGNRQPRHHQRRPIAALLETSDGLIEQDTVGIRVPELRSQGGQVVASRCA
jgi:hypothetical protein